MGREVMVTTARSALVKGYASTVVNAVRTWIAEGHQYASTVVNAVGARIVEGVKYAITVVNAVNTRNAKGVKCASTVVNAVNTRNAKGVKCASTVVNAVNTRNAKGVKNEANKILIYVSIYVYNIILDPPVCFTIRRALRFRHTGRACQFAHCHRAHVTND